MFLISQELLDAFEQEVVEPITMVSIDWPDGPIYAHNGTGPVIYDDKVWLGVGKLGNIGSVKLDSNVGSHTCKLELSGVDPDTLTQVTLNTAVNSDVTIYTGALGGDGQLIAAAPYYFGRISSVSLIRYQSDSISIDTTSKTADWSRNRSDRYTDESHRSRHPGDYFFQYVAQMAERDLYWGNPDKETIPLVPRSRQ